LYDDSETEYSVDEEIPVGFLWAIAWWAWAEVLGYGQSREGAAGL
jgi:hypothetical protein